MKRLELRSVRVCAKCGKGRAELESADGTRLAVPLDPVRARELRGEDPESRWVSDVVLTQLRAAGARPSEVVLDAGPGGLRALLSVVRGTDADVVVCTAQEGVGLAARGGLPIYATVEALGLERAADGHDGPGGTLH